MSICVIGGAGYIGSVTTEKLHEAGREVVVYDNLSRGHRDAVCPDVPLVVGDHGDQALLGDTLKRYSCSAVMHFSALSLVGESVRKPLEYYENNVAKGGSLLRAALEAGVKHFIFSSTAAVYGRPRSIPIREDDPLLPTNPYGNTKLAFERLLRDVEGASGLRSVSLRYFNAAGATRERGEHHNPETHLIPILIQTALGKREMVQVFGNDYDTDDGTCVRDYIHVSDLAGAHILALEHLEGGGHSEIFNLGNGRGFSVLEVIETVRKVTGKDIPHRIADRRPGDPPVLVASSDRIRRVLGWSPQYPKLEDIVSTAWQWHQSHPEGYGP